MFSAFENRLSYRPLQIWIAAFGTVLLLNPAFAATLIRAQDAPISVRVKSAAAQLAPKTGAATRMAIEIDRNQLMTLSPGAVGQIDLPGMGRIDILFSASETLPSGSIAWHGRLPAPYSLFTTDLILSKTGVVGDIRTPVGRYHVEADAKGAQYATFIDGSSPDKCLPDQGGAPSKIASKSLPLAVQQLMSQGLSSEDSTTVDVMFVYTPSVDAQFGAQLPAVLDSLVVTANTAMDNSRAGIRFRRVDAMPVSPRRAVTGDLAAVLKAVTASEDRTLPVNWDYFDVAARRNKVGADIVVTLVSRQDYSVGCAQGDECMVGASWQATQDRLANGSAGTHSFAVIDIAAHDLGLTFTHEIGHLFGAGHDYPTGGDGLNADAKAFLWNGGNNGTVMSYAPIPSLVFSSPDLTCGTGACGVAGGPTPSNNAQTVKSMRYVVGSYRDTAPLPPPDLAGIWNNADTGSNLYISQRGGLIAAAWLAFDAGGRPTWYLVSNCVISGSQCSGDLLRSWSTQAGIGNGAAIDPAQVGAAVAGTFVLDFSNPASPAMSVSVYGWNKRLSLSRQTQAEPSKNDEAKKSGFWWMSSGLETGVLVSEQAGSLYVAWLTYLNDGSSAWYVMPDCRLTADGGSCSGAMMRTSGGTGPDTAPKAGVGALISSTVGSAGITFVSPYSGTFSWTINGSSSSHTVDRDLALQ